MIKLYENEIVCLIVTLLHLNFSTNPHDPCTHIIWDIKTDIRHILYQKQAIQIENTN